MEHPDLSINEVLDFRAQQPGFMVDYTPCCGWSANFILIPTTLSPCTIHIYFFTQVQEQLFHAFHEPFFPEQN